MTPTHPRGQVENATASSAGGPPDGIPRRSQRDATAPESGSAALAAHQPLMQMLKEQARAGRFYAAIAQAPVLVLQEGGVLKGRRMTCMESVSDQLSGCNYIDQPVVVDGNCITAQGSAAALAVGRMLKPS